MAGLLVIVSAESPVGGYGEAATRLGAPVEVIGPVGSDPDGKTDRETDDPVDAIVAARREDLPSGVVAGDDDAVPVAARIAAGLGLPHHPEQAVALARDPVGRRRAFLAAGVPHPEYRIAEPGDDVAHLARLVGLPCVVYPAAGHRHWPRVEAHDDEDAIGAMHLVRSLLPSAAAGRHAVGGDAVGSELPLVVERSVPGVELALEGLVVDGALEVVALFERVAMPDPSRPDPSRPDRRGPDHILLAPSRLSRRAQGEVVRIAEEAVRALGLVHGVVHLELRADERFVRVLDVELATPSWLAGLPVGADRILEELLVPRLAGRADAGAMPVWEPGSGLAPGGDALGVLVVVAPNPGRLLAVNGLGQVTSIAGLLAAQQLLAHGDIVRGPPGGGDPVARLVARQASRREAEASLDRARQLVEVVIETRTGSGPSVSPALGG